MSVLQASLIGRLCYGLRRIVWQYARLVCEPCLSWRLRLIVLLLSTADCGTCDTVHRSLKSDYLAADGHACLYKSMNVTVINE